LATLINDRTRAELRDEIATIQAEIDEWKTGFDVESRDEFESTLTEGDRSSEEIDERNAVLPQWEAYEDDTQLLGHALELYNDIRSPRTG
jgi:hypothetical protein